MNKETKYPYVLFHINGSLYCLKSQYLSKIRPMPDYEKIPKAPASIMGMFRQDDRIVTLMDLRTELGYRSMSSECMEFEEMIDARKQDHLNWLSELERCIQKDEPFLLAKDPHQCAFGRWYYNFHTDNQAVAFHLRKIEEPHRKLHEAAIEVETCAKNHDQCHRETCLKTILKNIKEETAPVILKLMDETKDYFRTSIYKEMVLVLDRINCGIAVDEIAGIENLDELGWDGQDYMRGQCPYIRNVLQSAKYKGLIFELDVDYIAGQMGAVQAALTS